VVVGFQAFGAMFLVGQQLLVFPDSVYSKVWGDRPMVFFGILIALAVVFCLLAGWMWARPGPIKIGAFLATELLTLLSQLNRMQVQGPLAPCVTLLWLVVLIVALRGALAMKRLSQNSDLEVF
jgi:hypothetical protein